MACWRNEVKQGVNSVVAEPRVTLDPALLAENLVVLAFDVTHNLAEAAVPPFCVSLMTSGLVRQILTHVKSLSIWSPNPGVSTTVKEMRMPSSSSSVDMRGVSLERKAGLLVQALWTRDVPTVTGFMRIPVSMCACSGGTRCWCSRTGCSHSVLTKVVLPVPDWPARASSGFRSSVRWEEVRAGVDGERGLLKREGTDRRP